MLALFASPGYSLMSARQLGRRDCISWFDALSKKRECNIVVLSKDVRNHFPIGEIPRVGLPKNFGSGFIEVS